MKLRIFLISHFSFLICTAMAMQVQTDRTWYLAGEAMTVSVTADNALIAYAELCDTRGLAAGVAVRLQEGKGTAVIELPTDLHSGYYQLSAYTHGDHMVSHRLVAVINPLRSSVDDDIEWIETPEAPLSSPEGDTNVSTQSIEAPSGAIGGATTVAAWGTLPPDTEGPIIAARIKNVCDGQTFTASQIRPSMSIIGKQIHYFEGKMVNDTMAVFYTFGVLGRQPLVLSAMSSTGISLPIEMISPFAAFLPKQLPHLVFHYKRSEVEARSLAMQKYQRLRAKQPSEEPLPYDATLFGNQPDLTYNLDEYRQFLTIKEVLLEYVSCVKSTKTNGTTRLIVRKEQEVYDTSMPTLVLIDGMPVTDTERLLNYDARRIHYINIYGGEYTFGNTVYHGILSFVTRSGRLTNYPTERNMQYLIYDFPR